MITDITGRRPSFAMHCRIAALLLLLSAAHIARAVQIQPRIYGGKDAPQGKWPWMTAVLYSANSTDYKGKNDWANQFCGSFLIAPGWVVTAAHCIAPKPAQSGDPIPPELAPGDIELLVGAYQLDNTGNQTASERKTVSTINVNSLWSRQYGTNEDNDIALLQLSSRSTSPTTASLLDSTHDAALPKTPDDGLDVIGWGAIAPGSSPGTYQYPTVLQQVALDYKDHAKCQSIYGSSAITSNMICAYEATPKATEPDDTGQTQYIGDPYGEDSCYGDSGGPLFLPESSGDWVAGIVSFGDGCGNPDYPGVYTRIFKYVDWIENTTKSANDPLVDVMPLLTPTQTYVSQGGSTDVTVMLANHSLSNKAGGVALQLAWPTSVSVQDANTSDSLNCTSTGTSPATCTTSSATMAAGNSVQGPVTVTQQSAQNKIVTLTGTISATEDDYRSGNDTQTAQIIFSNSPDLSLTLTATALSSDGATVKAQVINKATHMGAASPMINLTLPTGMTLSNADALGCTGTQPLSCPLGVNLTAAGGATPSASVTFNLSATGGLGYTVSGAVDSADGNFPATDANDSVMFRLPMPASGGGGGGGGGGVGLTALLALAMAGQARRKKRSTQSSR